MNHMRFIQVIVVIASFGCSCCSSQESSARLQCVGTQQDELVRRISETRFETRATKPKLARCQKFVKLIQGQQELKSAGFVVDDPSALLDDIARILEKRRAGCPGHQPIDKLNSLQEFTEDCRELIELASGLSVPQADQSMEQTKVTAVQLVPGIIREIEIHREANGKLGFTWRGDIYGSIFVFRVKAGSQAARAGLRFGDQLIQVNLRPTAHMDDASVFTLSRVKLLVRSRPLEQTFKLKPNKGEIVPGFDWSSPGIGIVDVKFDQVAARAGLLENFNVIAVNGECVIGLDGSSLTWPERDFTVTVIPNDFYTKLTTGISPDNLISLRTELNEIYADEKGGLY